jgi:hypothetical protein
MSTLRQRVSGLRTFGELDLIAVYGHWTGVSGNPDISYRVVFGDSPSMSANTPAQVWPQSGNMALPTAAETLSIVSSSIQDDAGGTGIDAVFIEGLDGDYLPQQELVILNGTGAVTSTNSYLHVSEVNCLNVTTSGTTNAGNITITNSSSAQNLGYVMAGDSQSKHGQFIVPAGYNALIMSVDSSAFRTSGTGEKRAELDITFTPVDGGAGDRIVYSTIRMGISSAGVSEQVFPLPLVVSEKTCIAPKANPEANNTEVSVQYELLLIKDTVDIDSIF